MRKSIVVMICCALLIPAAAGCGGKRKGKSVRMNRLPEQPPAPPPRVNMPIDPALQSSAKAEMMKALSSSNPLVRAHAIEGLKDAMGPAAAGTIMQYLNDPSGVVRFAATLAVGELRVQQAKPQLLVLSDDRDASVRVGAKFALHRIGDTRQSHDLERTSRDPLPRTRGDTALVLGLLGEPSATKVLFPMSRDPNAAVRLQANEALWRLGNEQGLNQLVSSTVSKYPDDQMIALLGLAAPKDRRVLGHLEGSLVSEYDEVSLVAARACGLVGSDSGYAIAAKGAASSDPRQRMLAAMAFGAIGRSDAQPTLANLLKDPDADVRVAAATALLQLHQQSSP